MADLIEVPSGLEGVIAFETSIAEPDREGGALRYRGVDIEDLVGRVPFEKVWGLLVDGSYEPGLPPAESHPLAVRTGHPRADLQAALAMLAPEWGLRPLIDISEEQARADLARVSVMALSFVAQSARGVGRPPIPQREIDKARSIPERFLIRWRGEADPRHVKAIDAYWISAAEHGMNASTFTARVVASTGADVAAALSAGVGALSGPLHGGAPSRVLHMLDEVEATGDADRWVKQALDSGDRLMGFGHRVYRAEDPRASVLRRTAREIGAPRLDVAEQAREGGACRAARRAGPTACWPRTSSSGRRSCSTTPTWRPSCSRRCSRARAWPGGRRTSSSKSARAGWFGRARSTSAMAPRAADSVNGARLRLMEGGAPPPGAASSRTKSLVLVAAILGTAVVTVDSTVVNVALPAIEDDLGGGLAGQQWTSNAYLVTLGSLLLIGGSLGDIFGERRVFALGVLGFGVTSLACALAPTIELLVAARALQGVAGALLTPAALAVIVTTFPPAERGGPWASWTAWARHRHGARTANRRPARRHDLVALDLRDQRADRDRHHRADPASRARRARPRSRRARGLRRRAPVRVWPGRHDLWPDRAAAARLDRSARGAADWRPAR